MNQTASVGVWHYLGISALVLCPFSFTPPVVQITEARKPFIHHGKKCEGPIYLGEAGIIPNIYLFVSFPLALPWLFRSSELQGYPKRALNSTQRERERRILAFIYHNLYVEPHARPLTNIILFNFLNNPIQQPHNTWRSRNVEWRKEIKKHKGEGIWVYVVRKEEGRLSDTSLMQY